MQYEFDMIMDMIWGMFTTDGHGNPYHDKKNGRFTFARGSALNTERNECGGFSKNKRKSHFKDHGEACGCKNGREYECKAVEFMSKPLGEGEEEITLENGERIRYSYQQNLYGSVSENGNVSSFYVPNDGRLYWEDIKNGFGIS